MSLLTGFGNALGNWNSGLGQIASLFLGPLASEAMNRQLTADENELSRQQEGYMASVNQSNALQQMRVQQNWEKMMSDTAYQRAVADMEAAGLNPASLLGSSSAASTPSTGLGGTHSSGRGLIGYNSDHTASSLITSAFNAVLAKDKEAARIAGAELADNARHAHAMEENKEFRELAAAKRRYFDNKLYNDILSEGDYFR